MLLCQSSARPNDNTPAHLIGMDVVVLLLPFASSSTSYLGSVSAGEARDLDLLCSAL